MGSKSNWERKLALSPLKQKDYFQQRSICEPSGSVKFTCVWGLWGSLWWLRFWIKEEWKSLVFIIWRFSGWYWILGQTNEFVEVKVLFTGRLWEGKSLYFCRIWCWKKDDTNVSGCSELADEPCKSFSNNSGRSLGTCRVDSPILCLQAISNTRV